METKLGRHISFLKSDMQPNYWELQVEIPTQALKNTGNRLLGWKKQTDWVVVPTVYSKDKLVRGHFSVKELVDALDWPGNLQ